MGAEGALEIFYCYAREDHALRDELDAHLAALRHSGLISTWYDRAILPGTHWEKEIETHLNTARVILLLVSPDFIYSDYYYSKEMMRAFERHRTKEVRVIPVLLRSADWHDTPFSTLKMLPSNTVPVTLWANQDEAFEDVAKGIRRVIQELVEQKAVEHRISSKLTFPASSFSQEESAYPDFIHSIFLSSSFYRNVGNVLSFFKLQKGALAAYEHASSLKDDDPLLYVKKGNALSRLKNFEAALAAYEEAIRLDPGLAVAYENRGKAYQQFAQNLYKDLKRRAYQSYKKAKDLGVE